MLFTSCFVRSLLAGATAASMLAGSALAQQGTGGGQVCNGPSLINSPKFFRVETADMNKPWAGKFIGNPFHAEGTRSLLVTKQSSVAFRFISEKSGKLVAVRFRVNPVDIVPPPQPVQPVQEGTAPVTPPPALTVGGRIVVKLVKGDGHFRPSTLPADVLAETADNNELPLEGGDPVYAFKTPVDITANQPLFLVFSQLDDNKVIAVQAQVLGDPVPQQAAASMPEDDAAQGQVGGTQPERRIPLNFRDNFAGPYFKRTGLVLTSSLVAPTCTQGTACPQVMMNQWNLQNDLGVGNYELDYADEIQSGPSVLSGGIPLHIADSALTSAGEERIGGPNRVREAFVVKNEANAAGVWFRVWRDRGGLLPMPQPVPTQGGAAHHRPGDIGPETLNIYIRDAEFKKIALVSIPSCSIPLRAERQWLYAKFDSTLKLAPGKYYIVYRSKSPQYVTSLSQDGRAKHYTSKNIPNLGETDATLGVQVTTDDGKTWRSAKFSAHPEATTPPVFDPSVHLSGAFQVYQ